MDQSNLDESSMSTEISEEEKNKYEVNKMFNLAEKVILEYFCYFLGKTPEELFELDIVNMSSEEFILYPIKEYKNDKYLSFRLEMVTHDYKTSIPEELLNISIIKETLKFIDFAIHEVFGAIIHNFKNDMLQSVLDASFHFELDMENFTYRPVYVYPQRRKKIILEGCKKNLDNFCLEQNTNSKWEDLDENIKNNIAHQYEQITKLLEEINYDEDEANKMEEKYNEMIKKFSRIGIIFKEHPESLYRAEN